MIKTLRFEFDAVPIGLRKTVCVVHRPAEELSMVDLLGDPVPETPPMDAPLPWKVFKLNDCDWWVARTLDEAIADYRHQCGADVSIEGEHELTDKELDRLMYCDEDCKSRIPFRQALHDLVDAGIKKPEMFASTEH